MPACPLPPSFLDSHNLPASSLEFKASYIVISFLVLWSSCWSSSLAFFRNGSEYYTRGAVQVFKHLKKFLQYSLVSSSFLVLQRYCFFFLLSPLVFWCQLPIFPSILKFLFLQAFWFFLNLVVLFFPSFVVFCFSLLSWNIFLYQILSLYRLCISSGFQFFFLFLANSLMSSMYIGWLIFLAIYEVCIHLCIS